MRLGSIVGVNGALAIALAVFTISMLAHFRVPLLPAMGDDLGMSVAGLGLLTTMFAVGRLVVDVPAGYMVDRVRPRRLMAVSAFVAAVGSLMLAGAQGPLMAHAAAAVLGAGSAITHTTGMHFFANAAPIERRGASISAYTAIRLFGQAFGPTIAGAIASVGTWRIALASAGGLGAAVGLSGMRKAGSPIRELKLTSNRVAPRRAPAAPRHVNVVLLAVAFVMFGVFGATIHTLIPIIGDGELGLSPGQIGFALGVGGVFRLLGILGGGQISDRLSRKSAMVPALAVGALGVAIVAITSTYWGWLIGIVLIFVASTAVATAATMVADLAPPDRMGRDLGRYRFAGDMGLVIFPVLAASVFESLSKAEVLLPLAGLLMLTGLAVALLAPETHQPMSRQ